MLKIIVKNSARRSSKKHVPPQTDREHSSLL